MSGVTHFVLSATLHDRVNDTNDLLLNVTKYDIVVFTFGSLLVIVIFECRVPLPDNPSNLEECVAQVFGSFLGRNAMLGFVLSGFINCAVCTAEGNETVGRTKTVDVSNLACNQSGRNITYTWDAEKIRTELVYVVLYLDVVTFNTMLDVFQFGNGVPQFKWLNRFPNEPKRFVTRYKITMKNTLRHTTALGTDIFGNIQRLDNLLEAMPDKLKNCEEQLSNTRQQLDNALMCIERAADIIGIDTVRQARNIITHLQVVDDASFAKMEEYNVVANLNPWCNKATGFYHETEVKLLGEERASNEYPNKTFLDNNIHIAFGTDYGSSFTYTLPDCYFTFTTRMEPINPVEDTLLNPAEKFTRTQMLDMMTSGSAYQMHQESNFGTLAEGMDATLVVLNQNILEVSDLDLLNTAAEKTMFKGDWAYTRQ